MNFNSHVTKLYILNIPKPSRILALLPFNILLLAGVAFPPPDHLQSQEIGENPSLFGKVKNLASQMCSILAKMLMENKVNLSSSFSCSFRRLKTQSITKAYYGNLKATGLKVNFCCGLKTIHEIQKTKEKKKVLILDIQRG